MSGLLQPRPPERPRAQSAKTRSKGPSSILAEKRQSVALGAKLAASEKHAKSMIGTVEQRTRHGWERSLTPHWETISRERDPRGNVGRSTPMSSRYSPMNIFMCASCDKIYNTQKDLDIHKSFCYGRVHGAYTESHP